MTGLDIHTLASSFLYEGPEEDADSRGFAVGFLNILLQEALLIENSIREFEGKDSLNAAPTLTALSESIDYQEALLRTALPYGLASFYLQEAMDTYQAENYRGKYLSVLNELIRFNDGEAVDIYA